MSRDLGRDVPDLENFTIAAKILTKNTFQKELFWHNKFCKNYKAISLQSKILRMFSCKQGQASDSNIAKKMFWWYYFCNNYKAYYKNNYSKELFCNNFGQDGMQESCGLIFP